MENEPFDHIVIDNFLEPSLAKTLSDEFIDYDHPKWFCYDSPLENKKTLNDWYYFPKQTYNFFTFLNSQSFIHNLQDLTGIEKLYPDMGLHGAGWHIHGNGGKLNVHLDYSIHPKLKLQRKLNLIIYLSQDWDMNWGGNLELWSNDETTNQPKERAKVVECKYNRAIIFDTTQNSWHGFADKIQCPDNIYRKSIAMYYLCDPPSNADPRNRALYAPSEAQSNNQEILQLIKKRAML